MVGLGGGWGLSVLKEVPWGVVRKAPDKSLIARGTAETSAPFLYQRRDVARSDRKRHRAARDSPASTAVGFSGT